VLILNASNEGLPIKYHSDRSELVDKILLLSLKQRVILIQSPPSSGKTALAELIRHRLAIRGEKDVTALIMSLALTNNGIPTETWDAFFLKHVGFGFHDHLTSSVADCNHRYIIIDESQITFLMEGGHNSLWQVIKSLLGKSSYNNLQVILLASHGSFVKSGIQCFGSLPVKLPPESIVGLQSREANICSLMMTDMEYLSMVGQIEEPEWQRIFGLDTIREAISQISGNHIGIAHRTILYFFRHLDTYLQSKRSDKLGILTGYLNDPSNQVFLYRSIRQIPTVDEIVRLGIASTPSLKSLNPADLKILEEERVKKLFEILRDMAFGRERPLSPDSMKLKVLLSQAGMLYLDGTSTYFASPVHLAAFTNSLRTSPYFDFIPGHGNEELSLPKLVHLCVERMRSQYLLGCNSTNGPTEKHYHFEFWRVLTSTLPKDFSVQPEFRVDTPTNTYGWIDIRIQLRNRTWLIELLRDGDRVAEHVQRFEEGGRYACMPSSAIAIIDFRQRSARIKRPELMYCVFDKSFKCATLLVPNSIPTQITLCDD